MQPIRDTALSYTQLQEMEAHREEFFTLKIEQLERAALPEGEQRFGPALIKMLKKARRQSSSAGNRDILRDLQLLAAELASSRGPMKDILADCLANARLFEL